MATVAVINVKDSTSAALISYTLSDKNGAFALHNLPAALPLKVLITFVGYKPVRKLMTLTKGENVNLGTIELSSKLLQEISITGERLPIVVKADTIEFNAEAFKTRPNAVVEDLLKKLPGIEVANDGTITVNGKKVSKIMIDGREFFANDPKIASKNLDAALIAKVQVYDDREDDPDHLIEDSKVDKIINLKFKKALKKSIFGKVYGGAGTQGRYESGGLFNMFRDTLQVSIIGVGNNLSKTGFSRQELYSAGGFDRGGGDNVLNSGTFGGQSYSGIQSVATGGFNINNDYGKKLKLNLVYFLSHTQNTYNSEAKQRQFLNDTTLTSLSSSSRSNYTTKHNIGTTIKWKPDASTEIKYNPTITINNSGSNSSSSSFNSSNFLQSISTNSGDSHSNNGGTQFQQSFSFYKSLKKKRESITITHSLKINPDEADNYSTNKLVSYTSALPTTTLNRYSNTSTKGTDANLSASYRYPLSKKLIADVSISGNYNRQHGNLLTYDFNPAINQYNVYLDSLSYNLVRAQWTESVHPGITYNITKKITLVAGLSTQWQQIDNQFNKNIPDLNQNYLFILPNLRLSLGDMTLSYDANISQPSINDLQPIKYVYSPVSSYTGNPDLKPTKRNNFSANYYSYKPESQVNTSVYSNFTLEENSVYRRRTISSVGASTSSPVNRNGQYNGSLGFNIGKKFKKINDITIGVSTNIFSYVYHNFFQLNQDEGFQNNYSISASGRLSVNWKDIIEFEPAYSINRNITTYTGVNYNNVAYTSHSVDTHFMSHLPGKIDIEGSYNYTYNPLASAGFQKSINLVSMSLAHQLLKKDRGEIKLSCYDIFNQNVSAYQYAGANSITDVQSQIIKRYFLLTLLFKFNKAITK